MPSVNVKRSDLFLDVGFGDERRGTLHADVYEAADKAPQLTVLAVHGLLVTAATYASLVEAMFADPALGRVTRVVAVDLFGRRGSTVTSLPHPMRFGDIRISDCAQALVEFIDQLATHGLGPQIVLAHSTSTLFVQAVQETLLEQGTSLADRGVKGAIFLAPVPNKACVWTQAPPGELAQFIATDDALGAYIKVPEGFMATSGAWLGPGRTLASTAPTEEQVRQNHWVGMEPVMVCFEVGGSPGQNLRPFTRRGAFQSMHGTRLAIISFERDVVTPTRDHPALYNYLTIEDESELCVVKAEDAVHCMYITNPAGMLPALRDALELVAVP